MPSSRQKKEYRFLILFWRSQFTETLSMNQLLWSASFCYLSSFVETAMKSLCLVLVSKGLIYLLSVWNDIHMNQKCSEELLSWPWFSGYHQKWINSVVWLDRGSGVPSPGVPLLRPLHWPSGQSICLESRKARGSIPACAMGIFWVESYERLKNWHSSGYPARCLAL